MGIGSQSALAFANYYSSLLILQYLNKPKASAHVAAFAAQAVLPQVQTQTITFSAAPASGTFVLNYLPFGVNQTLLQTSAINWNDSASAIQTKIQALSGLGSVTVTGSISGLSLTLTLTGVVAPASQFTITSSTLQTAGSVNVTSIVAVTDVVLPLAVLNGFNLLTLNGAVTAVGAQLDILGKYAGVTRTGVSLAGQAITLNDTDFLALIQIATSINNSGSSLSTIQAFFAQFFGAGTILIFDYQNMVMSYFINSSIGSQNLIATVISQGLLPKPMGVLLNAIIYAPIINAFFGFRTYSAAGINISPFNTYSSYSSGTPWLTYADVVT